jgi:hypothetical protein
MPRKCTVCTHPDRESIDRLLVEGGSYTEIVSLYSVTKPALSRHKAEHLPATLVQAKQVEDVARADGLLEELQRITTRVNLLFDACDRWLRDPDDPTRYEIGPRVEDVKVTYEIFEAGDNGRPRTIRKKARLSDLLRQINRENGDEFTYTLVETKHADPRDLVLKAAASLRDQLELLARLMGELQEGSTVSVLVNPQWLSLRTVILQTLAPYPDARLALADALAKVSHDN